jgi:hypothetical protein
MTLNELIAELQKISEEKQGRDYLVRIWDGASNMRDLAFLHLVESDTFPELDHIALNTENSVMDFNALGSGFDLTKHKLS